MPDERKLIRDKDGQLLPDLRALVAKLGRPPTAEEWQEAKARLNRPDEEADDA